MAATLRGEATIAGTSTILVFDTAAIDRIEAEADASIFDLIEDVQRAASKNRKPKLSTLATLLWGAHLRHAPAMSRDDAYALVMSGDAAAMDAMSQALTAAFATQEAGADAAKDPPKKRTRKAAGS